MKLTGKRFLVIGGAGLIGSHTVDALLQEEADKTIILDKPATLALADRLRIAILGKRS